MRVWGGGGSLWLYGLQLCLNIVPSDYDLLFCCCITHVSFGMIEGY